MLLVTGKLDGTAVKMSDLLLAPLKFSMLGGRLKWMISLEKKDN